MTLTDHREYIILTKRCKMLNYNPPTITMTCTCSTPNQSCRNALPRVIGHYCSLLIPPSTPTEIGKLRIGDKFYFDQTPYNLHTLFADFGTYLVYTRPDGWLIQERDLKRVVNLIK